MKKKCNDKLIAIPLVRRLVVLLLAVSVCFFSPHTTKTVSASYPSSNNAYGQLSVPTQITKLGNTYYIVDCYHDQIIYNDSLSAH